MQAVQMAADGEELTPKEKERIERKWRRMTPEARARFNERWRQLHDPEFQRRKDERAHWRREFRRERLEMLGVTWPLILVFIVFPLLILAQGNGWI